MNTVDYFADKADKYVQQYHLYMIKRENGKIPSKNTDIILSKIYTKLTVFKHIIEEHQCSIDFTGDLIEGSELITKIKSCFDVVAKGFQKIDSMKKKPLGDVIDAILNQNEELTKIKDKFNLASTSEERMWLKFMYIEFTQKILNNLEKIKNVKEKISEQKINLLRMNYSKIEEDSRMKTNSMKELLAKYPHNFNKELVHEIVDLYDYPKVWEELFSDTREISTAEVPDTEEQIKHKILVDKFSNALGNNLKPDGLREKDSESFQDGEAGGGGGGGSKDSGDWREEFDRLVNGYIELENLNLYKQVVRQEPSEEAIIQAQADAEELLAEEAEAAAKEAIIGKKPNKGLKASKGKKKKQSKAAPKKNKKKEQVPEEAAAAASAKGHRATFEETVQSAMYGELKAGAKFAEVKRVKRWDIPNLDASHILDHLEMFPEYEGLSKEKINHQIILHSGRRLHRLLMDPSLLKKYAHKVRGGYTIDAILNLKNGRQIHGRFEFGVGAEDQKVFHRGFRIHMWGREDQNYAEIELANVEQRGQGPYDQEGEEEGFTAVTDTRVTVDQAENITVTLEKHSLLSSYIILPKR